MRELRIIHQSGDIHAIAISPDTTWLVSGSISGEVVLWNLQTPPLSQVLAVLPGMVYAVEFSFDGRYLVACSQDDASLDGVVTAWTTTDWHKINELSNPTTGGGYDLAFLSPGPEVVVAHADGHARIWHIVDKTVLRVFQEHSEMPVVASNPQTRMLSVANNTVIDLWDFTGTQKLFSLQSSSDWVKNSAFSPSGTYFACANFYGPAMVWSGETGQLLTTISAGGQIYSLTFDERERNLIAGCCDGNLRIIKLANGAIQDTIAAHTGWIRAIRVVRNAGMIITCSTDATIKVWRHSFG
jgi:WD40 repeat protein